MATDGLAGIRRWGAAAALLPLLLGCTVGPDYERPKPWWAPTSWWGGTRAGPNSRAETAPPDPNWWEIFHDRELTSLENRIASANLDLRVSTLRIAESRSQLALARADLFPTFNADGSYTRERVSPIGAIAALGGGSAGGGPNGASGFASGGLANFASGGAAFNGATGTLGAIPTSAVTHGLAIPPFNLWQYGFDATWELDLWGKVRRAVEVARATAQAAEDVRRNTLISVEAELARDYILLRGVQRQIGIIRENLRSEQESLKLTEERAAAGLTTELDVANQRAQVTSTAAQLPGLEAQETQYINALSLLLGQLPRTLRAELIQPRPIPPAPPVVPIGLPSELLRRRPDIRQAEAQLHAATANIGVAVADFFPSLSLAGSFGFQALTFGNMFNWNARQYGVGPTVTLPIFQGGRITGTLDLRKQQQKEAAITYQRTVLQALHDVDNSLIAYRNEQRRRDELVQTVAAGQRALALARDRYVRGISSFLDVLDAERVVLSAEVQLNDSTTAISTDLVALYKALGGGWETTYPAAPSDMPRTRARRERL
jgi:NodT family efflux transporter outer membrane factor (OMF) lipoprotein